MASTKTDMERIGLFEESGYVSIGDRYVPRFKAAFNDAANKGRQIMGPHSKMRCGLQDGYFDKKFMRVFEGEGYSDPIRLRRLQRIDAGKLNLAKPFMPASGSKDICGVGNYYGSFSGFIEAMSPSLRISKAERTSLRNAMTNPGKKGTGYGYPRITLSEFRKHMTEPFDTHKTHYMREVTMHKSTMKGGPFRLNMYPQAFFDDNPYIVDSKALPPRKLKEEKKEQYKQVFKYSSPGKLMSGDKAGTFERYPTHSVDVYNPRMADRPVTVVNKSGKLFYPNYFYKSRPINSVMHQNIMKEINVQNYRKYKAMTASF